jgi:hypothetical protein
MVSIATLGCRSSIFHAAAAVKITFYGTNNCITGSGGLNDKVVGDWVGKPHQGCHNVPKGAKSLLVKSTGDVDDYFRVHLLP